MEVYDVCLEDQPVGQVRVTKQGLYYCFECTAKLSGAMPYRLRVMTDTEVYDLGILIPVEKVFGISTKVPIKRFQNQSFSFALTENKPVKKGLFVPIRSEESFAYLQRLEQAYLEFRQGQPGARWDA